MTTINVFVSAVEADLGTLFVNFRRGAVIHMALTEIGHEQPPTPAVMDSATGDVYVN